MVDEEVVPAAGLKRQAGDREAEPPRVLRCSSSGPQLVRLLAQQAKRYRARRLSGLPEVDANLGRRKRGRCDERLTGHVVLAHELRALRAGPLADDGPALRRGDPEERNLGRLKGPRP